ncbi:four helix bundle protein [Chitinophagaceae bacterium MMS25-I14]
MDNKTYKSFTELDVWQQARFFKLDVYTLIQSFPQEEKYCLTDQLRRAARSIPANISEGYGRYTYKDQLHFCVQARGSLFECKNHIIDAADCNYISGSEQNAYLQKSEALTRLLNGYIAWLRTMISSSK